MKSPHEEDSRNIEQHDPSEVVRAANIFVDEVIAKAQEEALIKYQKRQEEDESAFEEGKLPERNEHRGSIKIPETESIAKHDADVKTVQTILKIPNDQQPPHPHLPTSSHPDPLPTEQRSRHLLTSRNREPSLLLRREVEENFATQSSHHIPPLLGDDIPYFSSTAFDRAHVTRNPTKLLILKIFVLLVGCVLTYGIIFVFYKVIQRVLKLE